MKLQLLSRGRNGETRFQAVKTGAASERIETDQLKSFVMAEELALDGTVSPMRGVLPIALLARAESWAGEMAQEENPTAAGVMTGLRILRDGMYARRRVLVAYPGLLTRSLAAGAVKPKKISVWRLRVREKCKWTTLGRALGQILGPYLSPPQLLGEESFGFGHRGLLAFRPTVLFAQTLLHVV